MKAKKHNFIRVTINALRRVFTKSTPNACLRLYFEQSPIEEYFQKH